MSQFWLLLICATTLVQGTVVPPRPLSVQQLESPGVPSGVPELVIPAGTELQLNLHDPLSSKLSEPGDEVIATLRREITADGMVLLPRGTEFFGKVTSAVPAKKTIQGRSAPH